MTIFRLELKPDLEQEIKACMLCKLDHELAPVLVSSFTRKSRKRNGLSFFQVDRERVKLLLDDLSELFISDRLVEVHLVKLYMRHDLLLIDRKICKDLQSVFDLRVCYLFLCPGALHIPWLVV